VSRVVARLYRRVRCEGGYTLTELLVTMVILSIVIAGLTGLFSAGLRAETDVAFRSRSQSEARNALSYLRQEVHCASGVTPSNGTATNSIQLTLPSGCFRPASETAGTPSTWCTVLVATNRYALYRKSGATCDNTGKLFADYLTSANVFKPYAPVVGSSLGYLNVQLVVDTNSQSTSPNAYRLTDDIVLRNTSRS
jgi:prepilin-type N-terminal cleavage/methylation domain-containing protein